MDSWERMTERFAWRGNDDKRWVKHCENCGKPLAYSQAHQQWVHQPGGGERCQWVSKTKASK